MRGLPAGLLPMLLETMRGGNHYLRFIQYSVIRTILSFGGTMAYAYAEQVRSAI